MDNTDLNWHIWLLIILGIILLSPYKDPCYYGSNGQSNTYTTPYTL